MKMRIIPAIDLMDGNCVRLTEGDFNTRKVYASDPLDTADGFWSAGLQHLHLVDLDGARRRKVCHWEVLERITTSTGLQVDFSGGITDGRDVEKAFRLGAHQVAVGSMAVREPGMVKEWLDQYGADRIIIGADARDGMIATHGWQRSSGLAVKDFISSYLEAGAVYFLCTDVSLDGRLQGPATNFYRDITRNFPGLRLIASGGVSGYDDLSALEAAGCEAAIVGKAIYEGRMDPEVLGRWNSEDNVYRNPQE